MIKKKSNYKQRERDMIQKGRNKSERVFKRERESLNGLV
jgi:hypothetical protein